MPYLIYNITFAKVCYSYQNYHEVFPNWRDRDFYAPRQILTKKHKTQK